jgi:hypothetical protein
MECYVEGLANNTIAVALPELPFGNLTEKRHSELAQRIREALEFMELKVDMR